MEYTSTMATGTLKQTATLKQSKPEIVRLWLDVLCSECYAVLLRNQDWKESFDEGLMCETCDDWVFPILIGKRAFRSHESAIDEIHEGIEIYYIGGMGIRTQQEVTDG